MAIQGCGVPAGSDLGSSGNLRMELPGIAYLYSLATVSITFVGFAALLIVVRQSIGGQVTSYDMYFTLSFIQV